MNKIIQLITVSKTHNFQVTYEEYKRVIEGKTEQELVELIKNEQESESIDIILKIFPNYIKFIKKPTTEQQKIVIYSNPYTITEIENPSIALQKMAIRLNPKTITGIQNPKSSIKTYAIKQDPFSISFIKHTTKSNWDLVFKSELFDKNKDEFIAEIVDEGVLTNNIPFDVLLYLHSITKIDNIKKAITNHFNWKNDAELIILTMEKINK